MALVALVIAMAALGCSAAEDAHLGARHLVTEDKVFHVPSQAMAPMINAGDRVVAAPVSNPHVGDVVVFDNPPHVLGDKPLVKRIVARGGDEISFVDDEVVVNGVAIDEPYLFAPRSTRLHMGFGSGCIDGSSQTSCVVPADTFFVLGDHRLMSQDSRTFGPIPAASVTHVVVEVFPG